MKKSIFFLFFLLISSTEIFSNDLLPKDIYFHVYRNGTKIGFHKIDFSLKKSENNLSLIQAKIEINFDVKFLGFSVYNYKHSNNETWKIISSEMISTICKKCKNLNMLVELDSVTNKNGSGMFCNIKRNLKGNFNSLLAKGSQASKPMSSHIYTLPSSYWDFHLVTRDYIKNKLVINEKKLLKEKTVFNSQDCSKINFTINSLGEERIYNGFLNANKYNLKGKESSGEDINIDIWYDSEGNWVKMVFIKDGSEIEYFLDKYHEKK